MKRILFGSAAAILAVVSFSAFKTAKHFSSFYYENAGQLANPVQQDYTYFGATAPVKSVHCNTSTTIICFATASVQPSPGETTMPTTATIGTTTLGLWH